MHSDVCSEDNWALLLAAHIALDRGLPLRVIYVLPRDADRARTVRHADFLFGGLRAVKGELVEVDARMDVVLYRLSSAGGTTRGTPTPRRLTQHSAPTFFRSHLPPLP